VDGDETKATTLSLGLDRVPLGSHPKPGLGLLSSGNSHVADRGAPRLRPQLDVSTTRRDPVNRGYEITNIGLLDGALHVLELSGVLLNGRIGELGVCPRQTEPLRGASPVSQTNGATGLNLDRTRVDAPPEEEQWHYESTRRRSTSSMP
jgi:hypothetical protein